MKGHKSLDSGPGGKSHCLWQCAVPPAHMGQIFGRSVLSVVNQQIHPGRELKPRRPIGLPRKMIHAESGLMVRQIGQ